jgi:endonuclease/exonuclease/phosphatase family metal-dependent hydrolase
MSYNIRLGVANDGDNAWDLRKSATPAMLKDQDPLCFGVQEAYGFQIDYINETCPQYASIGVGRDDGVEKGEHMSIFYKKDLVEVVDWGTYWLSETPDVPSKGWDAACYRTATWALLKIKKTGTQFYYVNTHLDHVGVEARKNGLALIVERIAAMNPDGYPMILTGDLNVRPTDPCLVDLDKQMKSARIYAEKTTDRGSFNGWGRASQPIDYVYYSGFEKCTEFDVVDQSYDGKPYISDHYPVYAILVF